MPLLEAQAWPATGHCGQNLTSTDLIRGCLNLYRHDVSCDGGFDWLLFLQIVPDNYLYARVALVVKDKGTLTEEKLPELTEVLGDAAKAQEVGSGGCGTAGRIVFAAADPSVTSK